MSTDKDVADFLYEEIFQRRNSQGYTKYQWVRSNELENTLIARYRGLEKFRELAIKWCAKEEECTDEDFWEWIKIHEQVTEYRKNHKGEKNESK